MSRFPPRITSYEWRSRSHPNSMKNDHPFIEQVFKKNNEILPRHEVKNHV